jgi:hypothetical protein
MEVGSSTHVFHGIREDAPLEVTSTGAVQSSFPYKFANIPPEAMYILAEVLNYGVDKYCKDGSDTTEPNMRNISVKDHINHALGHIYAFLAGQTDEDHLSHALCRIVYAVTVQQYEPYKMQYQIKEQ